MYAFYNHLQATVSLFFFFHSLCIILKGYMIAAHCRKRDLNLGVFSVTYQYQSEYFQERAFYFCTKTKETVLTDLSEFWNVCDVDLVFDMGGCSVDEHW